MRRLLAAALALTGAGARGAAQELYTGRASYYADRLHGRRMSNGERYNRDSMTCAHLRFPFGTLLRVRNPINGKEVVVEVTDRGPFSRRYIIDLSRAAARELDIIGTGFSQVEITPYDEINVPYRARKTREEVPELNLEYSPSATYPTPTWRGDTTRVTPPDGPRPADSRPRPGKAGSGR